MGGLLNWNKLVGLCIVSLCWNKLVGLAQLLDLQSVARGYHISLMNIVQLLLELKLARRGIGNTYFLELAPLGFFLRFCLSNVAKHVIMDIGC